MRRVARKLYAMWRAKSFALFDAVFLKRFWQLGNVFHARIAHIFIASLAGVVLAGCSAVRIVDSQVAAFSKLEALPATSSWRFERLPSQQSLDQVAAGRQSKLEAVVAQELAKQGFADKPLAAGAANFTVQINARIQRLEANPFDELGPWGMPGRDYIVARNGQLIYMPVWPRYTPPWYVREVSILIRDTSDNRVVYETQAKHEGRWADDDSILPAMFAAALQGFPKPPEGKRMVNIEIPR